MAKTLTVALAGNPNSGKTTLFNTLTGSRQHVGNYPGITVDKKEGYAQVDGQELHLVDLPGTYSLTAYSQEELVARNFLADTRPDVVVDVANASALERNLYLAVQFLEMGAPLVLVLNMIDEARKHGQTIDSDLLSQRLGVPVVETVARYGQGKQALLKAVQERGKQTEGDWEPLYISYGPDLDPVLKEMTEWIEREEFLTDRYPARWVALKYLENDDEIRVLGRKHGQLASALEEAARNVAEHCEKTLNTYPEAIIADYRYGFITSALRGVIRRDEHPQRLAVSDQMDKVLTHRLLGPAIMFSILYLVYQLTFSVGEIPMGWVETFFAWLGDSVRALLPDGMLQSLLVSGVIDGVGGVLGFVPLIMIIFLCIAVLEDSGYMARIAYMLDRVFRLFGLHGCSIMPYIVSGGIAGGCAVPGVMASRTLRSPREKLATLITVPFMVCGAKVPVFILLVGVFFPHNAAQVLFLITLVAWAMALTVAKFLRLTLIRGPSTPFVMELPPYRTPTLRGVLIHTWERTWQYIKKAGTVILALSILIWAGMTFPQLPQEEVQSFQAQKQTLEDKLAATDAEATKAALAEDLNTLQQRHAQAKLSNTVAGRLGQALEPVSEWAGFDWRTNIALIGGVAAKEVIVSSLGTAYSLEVGPGEAKPLAERLAADPQWTKRTAVSAILFILLYAPCFVTVVAMAKETGNWRWPLFSVVFNTLLAFGIAVGVYQLGGLFMA
ncbi:MAG: ferrous iron transport protein B [Thermodesulfobacteriota bacterium]